MVWSGYGGWKLNIEVEGRKAWLYIEPIVAWLITAGDTINNTRMVFHYPIVHTEEGTKYHTTIETMLGYGEEDTSNSVHSVYGEIVGVVPSWPEMYYVSAWFDDLDMPIVLGVRCRNHKKRAC